MIKTVIVISVLVILLFRQLKKLEALEEEELKEFYRNHFELEAIRDKHHDR